MSLKLKVNLFFAVLMLASLLASTGVLISNARQSVQSEVESTMTASARLITVTLSGTALSRDMRVSDQIHDMVQALSEIRSLHILMFDSQGLLFEGEPETNLSVRPPDWFIKVLFPKIQPLTKRFGGGHMVIYAAPLQEISERWLDIRGILALGLSIFIFVGLFLYWGIDRLMRPLQRLVDALAGFERGDLHLRLPRFALAEMDQISQTFNRMGQALELSTEENRRLAVLVTQSGDAILSLDHASNITFCNPAAEKLFVHQTKLLIGDSLANIGFTEHQQHITTLIENCQTVENLETGLLQPDGEVVSILFSTVPLFNAEREVIGVICTLRDITEHKQAEAAENQLRETRLLAQHMAEVQEAERRHLARELHDELGQCLTAIKTDAVLIRNRTQTSEPKLFTSAQAIIDVASHIYDVVHNMITRLRPSPLDDLGLLPTLQESIAAWQQRQPEINFKLDVAGKLDHLNEAMNMTVFRVVQESLTNAVRHADASEISVIVANKPDEQQQEQITIDIRDDGKGMEVNDFHSDVDFGLLGMRERAHSLGGQFNLESSLGNGVRIHITIPLGADKTV
ncbi:methanol utilization protein MoxY [Methylophaga sp. 42_25_T18]|nr:methanol utilization protein MoxY [Methylophaga sp. 42_25_T18]OUR85921.1 methanol utilization protein MoxY [Methylophaga sp. 42_8_T64]